MSARARAAAVGAMVALAGLTLAGCAADGGGPPAEDRSALAADAPAGAASRQALAPIADPARDRDRAARLAALPTISDDPDQFLGLDALEAARRLGAPQLVRRDGTAEVWVFQGTGCTLDVFLYAGGADADEATLAVRHVELRSPAQTQAERRACLRRLLENEALRRQGATS
ncbi:MAG: hypothetical protein RIB45_17555 [Marivibrio sp.]|uniref:hypothetical protein n=1 Tax=Marivibrio sp. TaxID=2039719 RepID=UPI0032EB6E11